MTTYKNSEKSVTKYSHPKFRNPSASTWIVNSPKIVSRSSTAMLESVGVGGVAMKSSWPRISVHLVCNLASHTYLGVVHYTNQTPSRTLEDWGVEYCVPASVWIRVCLSACLSWFLTLIEANDYTVIWKITEFKWSANLVAWPCR